MSTCPQDSEEYIVAGCQQLRLRVAGVVPSARICLEIPSAGLASSKEAMFKASTHYRMKVIRLSGFGIEVGLGLGGTRRRFNEL